MKKLACFMMICVLGIFNVNTASFAFGSQSTAERRSINTNGILERDAVSTSKKVVVSGKIPEVSGGASEINKKIAAIEKSRIEEAEKNGINLVFSWKEVKSGNVISLIITSSFMGTASNTKINTVVYDNSKDPKELITITHDMALGKNGIAIANKAVNDEIAKRPGRYNVAFKSIEEDADFYIDKTGKKLVLVFDKYELSSSSSVLPEISVSIEKENLKHYIFETKDNDLAAEATSLNKITVRMVPLRKISEHFGYSVSFLNNKIQITGDDFTGTIEIGVNEYSKNNISVEPLETAPVISKKGVTYVPISYMEKILGLFYSIGDNGDIIFSQYKEIK